MENTKPRIRISVRAVVSCTLHESDLAPASAMAKRMREGAAAHRARQQMEGMRDAQYRSEVALSAEYEAAHLTLHVSGRADGVTLLDADTACIEEIKLGAPGAPLAEAHWAQAALYGHMLCLQEGYARVHLRILYVDAQGERLEAYEETIAADALRETFCLYCEQAAAWEELKRCRRQARDASLAALAFPFAAYRAGQKRFAQNAFVAIRDRKRLFAQAPTGIGKTMAALYPSLVAIGQGVCARALFLTARTTGRRSAVDALLRLKEAGAQVLAVEIAAKDKVCPQETRDCRAQVCPCAAGFYDRLPAALAQALASGGVYDRARVEALAKQHTLCPFELSLELAALADVVIGDYNYVYDPFVRIDALLHAPGKACLLVDEAHQLAPRVRDAYSGGASVAQLRALRREIGKRHGRGSAVYKAMSGAMAAMKECAQTPSFASGRLDAPPQALCKAMQQVMDCAGEQLALQAGAEVMEAFSLAASFLLAAERFDARYAALCAGEEKTAEIRLCCLDASAEILEASRRAQGAVYFSATLAPFDAARRVLGSEAGDANLALPSPFDPANLSVRVEPIDIRYAAREKTAPDVAEAIAGQLQRTSGHTIVYFPAYAYMERVYELLMGMEDLPQAAYLKEARGMREDEKNALLGAFDAESGERAALFAVLGGAFSEGIDLPGDRLKNVIIVSTGMPQPDAQVRAMQAYYEANGGHGFDLAMTLPGMTRVIQAAGRLIRTDTDSGTLLLIDSRYQSAKIRALLADTLVGQALSR